VVRRQHHPGPERYADVRLDTARYRLVDIDRLAEQVDVGPVAMVHAARTIRRRSETAVRDALAARDLVLEVVVEQRDAGAEGSARVVQRHFRRSTRLGLQAG